MRPAGGRRDSSLRAPQPLLSRGGRRGAVAATGYPRSGWAPCGSHPAAPAPQASQNLRSRLPGTRRASGGDVLGGGASATATALRPHHARAAVAAASPEPGTRRRRVAPPDARRHSGRELALEHVAVTQGKRVWQFGNGAPPDSDGRWKTDGRVGAAARSVAQERPRVHVPDHPAFEGDAPPAAPQRVGQHGVTREQDGGDVGLGAPAIVHLGPRAGHA